MAIDIGWSELGASGRRLALYLVLEGILPFLNPGRCQAPHGEIGSNGTEAVALGGLISMVIGLALLWMARNG